MNKTYQNGKVGYGFTIARRKWGFKVGEFTLYQACQGAENAHKVASLVNKSFERSGSLDNVARASINKLTFKPLRNFRPAYSGQIMQQVLA